MYDFLTKIHGQKDFYDVSVRLYSFSNIVLQQ